MKTSSRFTMSVHLLVCVDRFADLKATSDFIASSIGTNPVIVRKLLGQLKAAGLVDVARGSGGASLAREAGAITLLDVFEAVEGSAGELFRFHEHPNELCPVGRNIHAVMDGRLAAAEKAFERELRATTIEDVSRDIGSLIERQDDKCRSSQISCNYSDYNHARLRI